MNDIYDERGTFEALGVKIDNLLFRLGRRLRGKRSGIPTYDVLPDIHYVRWEAGDTQLNEKYSAPLWKIKNEGE